MSSPSRRGTDAVSVMHMVQGLRENGCTCDDRVTALLRGKKGPHRPEAKTLNPAVHVADGLCVSQALSLVLAERSMIEG